MASMEASKPPANNAASDTESATDSNHPLPAIPPADEQLAGPSVKNWSPASEPHRQQMKNQTAIDAGWGRLLFGQTFYDHQQVADSICQETPGKRDIALYLRDPHVLVSLMPDRLFLDPSHTYRLWLGKYQTRPDHMKTVDVIPLTTPEHEDALNRIFVARHMVPVENAVAISADDQPTTYHIAVANDQIVGGMLFIDHTQAFNDPENGASFWSLAVDPQCQVPGVGESLVRHAIQTALDLGRAYIDLSVMHNNHEAIGLYEKLGFERVPAFCVKYKNPINEPYYTPEADLDRLNPYARIIVDEARRRGIRVKVQDAEHGFFELSLGGRRVSCRESLSDLTSAVAMSRCENKHVTRKLLEQADIQVPAQQIAGDTQADEAFLNTHQRIVVKPAKGEQGAGISVDVRDAASMAQAIVAAQKVCDTVLLEAFVEGKDLRTVVIGDELVAAAVRLPATIVGAQGRTVRELINRYNRRRQAATGGESSVPMDEETVRCVQAAGFGMDDVVPDDQPVVVRKTANLHTGGTIHDVTDQLHPTLKDASIRAAQALNIPVVGLDLLVPSVDRPEYVMIEANERVGLANHEPQPTAERFIDLLFPQTVRAEDAPA